jgi:plastocyanin
MTALISWRARWILAATVTAVALVLASQASAGPAATASKAKKVSIVNFTYKPGKLTVTRGTKVAFANMDSAPHTATGRGFDTGNIGGGATKSVKFGRAGTFAYHCTIHPSMHGKIVVK